MLLYGALAVLACLFGGPFLWAVSSSLKAPEELFMFPPKLFPAQFQWANYAVIWQQAPLVRFILNTVVVTALAMVGQILSASLVAYGFARFRFPGRETLFLVVLSTLMIPVQVTIVPIFVLYKWLGWLDTIKPLVVPVYFGGGAFAIFLFRQFFLNVPMSYDEAAKIDGASYQMIFLRILLPLSKPVLITMAIFSFLFHWNDFFGPLIFLNSSDKFTISLGLTYFMKVAIQGGKPTDNLLLAAAMVMTVPCIVVFVVLQKYFVRGIVMSGLKG
jgi:multiple sugar transport system permease protein